MNFYFLYIYLVISYVHFSSGSAILNTFLKISSGNKLLIHISSDKSHKYVIESYVNFNKTLQPKIPSFQRSEIENRSIEFLEDFMSHYNKTKNGKRLQNEFTKLPDFMPYRGELVIGTYNRTNYILDGQHRYYAMNLFFDNIQQDFNVWYKIKEFTSRNDLTKHFQDINSNKPINQKYLNSEFLELRDKLKEFFTDNFPRHISTKDKPKYPNLNLDILIDYIDSSIKSDFDSYDTLIKKILELNSKIGEQIEKEDYEKYLKAKVNPYNGLYLSFLFQKKFNEKQRNKIPKSVRRDVWDRDCDDFNIGKCKCCSKEISRDEFHCGHKISLKNGGNDSISNLIVLCPPCNLSMGTRSFHEFKSKYYSNISV